MKKNITAAAIAIGMFTSLNLHAQDKPAPEKRFYMKVAGGYFFSVSPGQFPKVGSYDPHEIIQTRNMNTGATTVVSDRVLTGSYGAGVRGGITAGFDINQHVAVELSANYYHSKKNLMTHQLTTAEGSGTRLGEVESHGHVNAIDVVPAIVIKAGSQGRFDPYVRIGAVLPVWGRLYIETDGYQAGAVAGSPTLATQLNIHRKEAITPNATVGFLGALGVTCRAGNRISVFLEAEFKTVPVKGKSKEVNEYSETLNVVNTTNGSVVRTSARSVNDLSTAERSTKYVDVLTTSSNTPTGATDPANPTQTQYKDNNRPSDDLKSYINIGGLGFNAGIKFRI